MFLQMEMHVVDFRDFEHRVLHYSYNLLEFLAEIGVSLDDPDYARTCVTLFMLTKDAQRMPRRLRKALISKGLLDTDLLQRWRAGPDPDSNIPAAIPAHPP